MIAFRNLYPNLPGHLVEFKDGGLALRVEADPPQTDSMLILGTAVDGPVMEPVAVDATTAETLFGKSILGNGIPNGSTLVPAFEEAWNAGCRDIRLMRISGAVASKSIEADGVTTVVRKLISEQLGLALGNNASTFQLSKTPVIPNSVRVYADSIQITAIGAYSVDVDTGEVVLAANACSAGAPISIAYQSNVIVENLEETLTVAAGKVTLTHNIGEIKGFTVEGSTVTPTYTTLAKDVIFTAGVVDGDEVTVQYDAITADLANNTESTFVAATGVQPLTITKVADTSSIHVYANETEIPKTAFTVDLDTMKINLKKETVTKGARLETSYNYNESTSYTPVIEISSIFGGAVYNGAKVQVVAVEDTSGEVIGMNVVLTKPDSKKAQITEEPLVFSSIDYPTFQLLTNAINNNANNGVFKAQTRFGSADANQLKVLASSSLVGGSDGLGLNEDQLFEALSGKRDADGLLEAPGAYQLLEDYQVDWVVPVGVYADTEMSSRLQNFAYELALFCAVLSNRNKMTFGVINMKPVQDTGLAGIQSQAKKLAAFENFYIMKDSAGNELRGPDGKPIDLGGFINVIAGPEVIVSGTSLGVYNAEPAVTYVGFSTTLQPQAAASNKAIASARGIRYRFSNAQLDGIVGRRLTVLKTKPDGSVAVVDDVSASLVGSDYARRSTGKVVRETVDQIREVCDPFIGMPNTIEQRNAMSATISKRLGQLKDAGVIQDFDFQVVATLQDQLLGQAKIELTLVPPQELRKITTVVSLKPSL